MNSLDPRESRARLAEEERSHQPRKPWRDRLYGGLKVSVRTMDLVIGGIVALIVVALVVGIILGRS